MKAENHRRILEELAADYPDAVSTTEASRTLIKIPNVHLPKGCLPLQTSALVVLDEAQQQPQLHVKDLPKLPNGTTPRSTSAVQFVGEKRLARLLV